jgi:hypothetical protein
MPANIGKTQLSKFYLPATSRLVQRSVGRPAADVLHSDFWCCRPDLALGRHIPGMLDWS